MALHHPVEWEEDSQGKKRNKSVDSLQESNTNLLQYDTPYKNNIKHHLFVASSSSFAPLLANLFGQKKHSDNIKIVKGRYKEQANNKKL